MVKYCCRPGLGLGLALTDRKPTGMRIDADALDWGTEVLKCCICIVQYNKSTDCATRKVEASKSEIYGCEMEGAKRRGE